MNRRELVSLLATAAVFAPRITLAQTPRQHLIGFFGGATETVEGRSRLAALRDGLQALGRTHDKDYRIEARWLQGDMAKAQAYAQALVSLKPDIIVSISTPVTRALKQATSEIPIVFTTVTDPVGDGLVDSLAKPGGNITGFMSYDFSLATKWLELLKELSPNLIRVGAIFNPITAPGGGWAYVREAERAATALKMEIVPLPAGSEADLERGILQLGSEPRGGLLVIPDSFTQKHSRLIVEGAARYRLPAVYPLRNFVPQGGLIIYGVDIADQIQQSAMYVDRILRGEKPRDLPVQAPNKLELVINLKTARALGLTIPPSILLRADEVIE